MRRTILLVVLSVSGLFAANNTLSVALLVSSSPSHSEYLEAQLDYQRVISQPDLQHPNYPWMDRGNQFGDDSRKLFAEWRLSGCMSYRSQLRDSVWVNYFKWTYDHDFIGNMTEELGQGWENDTWVNVSLRIYSFDTEGNWTEALLQDWGNNTWVNNWKGTYSHDTNGNMTELVSQIWENNTWLNTQKWTFSYDTNENKTEDVRQHWENNTWLNTQKWTFNYDTNGNMTEDLYQDWENSTWVNNDKRTFSFDTNGNMTEKLLQGWENETWVNLAQFTYSYDSNGNMTENLYQDWENSTWVNYWKWIYTYDEEAHLINASFYQWYDSWDYLGSIIYTYDANGSLVEKVADYESGSYAPDHYKEIYSYDNDGDLIEVLWQFPVETVETIGDEYATPEGYELSQNYPNPFNPSTTISYLLPIAADVILIIHDITGRTISTLEESYQSAGYYDIQWNSKDDSGNPVSTGVYFCRLTAGDYSKTIKMVYLR